MARRKKQEFILWSITTREPARDSRGRYIVRQADTCPRIEDMPRGFSPRSGGWHWAAIDETIVGQHKGGPVYRQLDWQVCRIQKIISSPKAK
jgi:hypothetical protein